MTDAFLAEVLTYEPALKTAEVLPLIMEMDGTPHPPITVKAVAGITPAPGDLVLVVTLRNNLDDEYISRFFEASGANGRIVHVVRSVLGYFFTGSYKITGSLEIIGSLDITGPLSVTGALDVTGALSATTATIGGIPFLTHTHANNAPAPGPTGPPL